MKPRAFLDANVLVPYDLTCLFLTLAEQSTIDVRWSDEILAEVGGALESDLKLPRQKVSKRVTAMSNAFPEARVVNYKRHEVKLHCDPKDRHVLAGAIESGSNVLVTINTSDFHVEESRSHGITLRTPDEFLTALSQNSSAGVAQAIAHEVCQRKDSSSAKDFLERLSRFAPEFVTHWRKQVLDLDSLIGWFIPPKNQISREEAARLVSNFLKERAASRVLFADGFGEALIDDGLLTVTWNGKKTVNGELLLGIQPFDNLADFIATPLSFNNEEGRQIRAHVRAVAILGATEEPAMTGAITTREAYARGTGIPLDWIPD